MKISFKICTVIFILFLGPFLVYGQQNPTISYITKERNANIGDTIDLQCSVHYSTGYPVVWVKINQENPAQNLIISMRSNQLVPDQRYSIRHDEASSTYTLQITKIQQIDTGLYQCQVIIGTASKLTEDAWIHVKIPPVILDNSTQSIATTTGSTVSLGCYATGYPIPKISWRRENNDVLPTGGVVYRGNILTIFNISKHDRGTYYCIADNGVPKGAKRHVGVDVEFIPVVSLPRLYYKQAVGYDMDLHCQVEAFPKPSIIWLKDQYQLYDNQRDYYITTYESTAGFTETKLRVSDIDQKDFGRYICKAINKLGHDKQTMYLEESYKAECPPACGISSAEYFKMPSFSELLFIASILLVQTNLFAWLK